MVITKTAVANQIAAYLHHEISLDQLVDWAENTLMEGSFDPGDSSTIADVIARLGLADVRAFGLTWEDCENLLGKLGFAPRVDVVAA
jgi:hypothetical protein